MTTALIVDDKLENLYLLEVLLKGHGFQVEMAANGALALEQARLAPPDILITDILMPVMDGFTLCRQCKQDPRLKKIPFIFYTATYSDPKDEQFALSLGADKFIIKPIEPDDFIARVEEVLAKYAAGELQRPPEPVEANLREEVYLKEYNEALVRKLEDKMFQLEAANRALVQSEDRFRRLADNAPAIIFRMSLPDGNISYVNPAAYELTGYTPEEIDQMRSRFMEILIHPEWRERFKARLARILTGEVFPSFEFPVVHKSGQTRWVEQRQTLILDEAGKPASIEGILTDITERKLAEERIQKQIARLAALHTIDAAINGGLDLRYTLQVLLEQTVGQLGVHAADILLFNNSTFTLDFSAGLGFRTNAMKSTHLRLDQGLAGRAVVERSTVSAPDLKAQVSSLRLSQAELAGLQSAVQQEGFASYYGVPLIAKGSVKGVLEVYTRERLSPNSEWQDFLMAIAGQAAIAIDNAELFENLQRSTMELALAYDTTLEGWSRALDLRDQETEGHTERVASMAVRLARALGLPEENIVQLRRGALLHDIGKMGIPDYILNKAGTLTEEEWDIMRQHPLYAFKLLSPIAFLRPALDVPYCHHEKWDGTGYPRGLKSEQIPLVARLFTVVDVWDALLSNRPYRSAWQTEQAVSYLKEQNGKHFDPHILPIFLKMIGKE